MDLARATIMDLDSLAVYNDEELELTMNSIKKLSDRRE